MTDDAERYLIWSNEHGAWWGPGEHGYVKHSAKAGRYRRERALAICIKAIPGTAQRLGLLPELPVRQGDLIAMLGAYRATYSGDPEPAD